MWKIIFYSSKFTFGGQNISTVVFYLYFYTPWLKDCLLKRCCSFLSWSMLSDYFSTIFMFTFYLQSSLTFLSFIFWKFVFNTYYNWLFETIIREHWTGEVPADKRVPVFPVFNWPLVLWKKYFVFIKTTYSSRYSFVACNSRYA